MLFSAIPIALSSPKEFSINFQQGKAGAFTTLSISSSISRRNSHQYERGEIFPYPEIDNPPRVWIYIDKLHGITIRTQSSRGDGGGEVVVSITYGPERKDEKLRCNNLKQKRVAPGLGLR